MVSHRIAAAPASCRDAAPSGVRRTVRRSARTTSRGGPACRWRRRQLWAARTGCGSTDGERQGSRSFESGGEFSLELTLLLNLIELKNSDRPS